MTGSLQKSRSAFSWQDGLLVLILTATVLLLGIFSITNNCQWGDDFAAYILQGISIAEGSFDEQIRLNHLLHPSYMPEEAVNGELVYVWGYSLIQALVYKLVGFDRLNYSSVIYYKLPSVISLALLAGVLYLFLRRRFGRRLSFLLAGIFGLSSEFFTFFETMYSDLIFLFFAMLALYLSEIYLGSSGRKRLLWALVLGAVLWFMYEVRLNGVSILFACILAHVMQLFPRRRELRLKELVRELLPYIVFLILKLVSEAILAPATSNTSDLGGTSLGTIYANVMHYSLMAYEWYVAVWNRLLMGMLGLGLGFSRPETFYYVQTGLALLSVVLFVLGVVCHGIKENFQYTALIFVYIFVASMLPYNQGLRYIFPLLPLMVMYTGYGLITLAGLLPESARGRKLPGALACLCVALVFVFSAYPQYQRTLEVQANPGRDSGFKSYEDSAIQNAYSDSAVEVYTYINENIPEDSVIAFFKPRALYLNTQRRSYVAWDILDRNLDDADYYLIFNHVILNPVPGEEFVPVWENEDFTMLKRQD